MTFRFFLFSVLILLFFSSCCPKDILKSGFSRNIISNNKLLKQTAFEYFGNNFNIIFNSDSLFAICQGFDKKNRLSHKTFFFIFDNKSDNIIFEDSVVNGEIGWIDNYIIEVKSLPGIIQRNQNPESHRLYLFNVRTRKKSK